MALQSVELRVVAFREGDTWVAQCLEHDIATQAPDLDSLMSRLRATVDAEADASGCTDGNPLAAIPPAPEYFHVMFDSVRATVSHEDGGDTDCRHMQMKIAA